MVSASEKRRRDERRRQQRSQEAPPPQQHGVGGAPQQPPPLPSQLTPPPPPPPAQQHGVGGSPQQVPPPASQRTPPPRQQHGVGGAPQQPPPLPSQPTPPSLQPQRTPQPPPLEKAHSGKKNQTWSDSSDAFLAEARSLVEFLREDKEEVRVVIDKEDADEAEKRRKARAGAGRSADKFARKNADSSLASQVAGRVQLHANQPSRALVHFRRATQLQPNSLEVAFYLATVHKEMERFDLAVSECRRALSITTPCDPVLHEVPECEELDTSAAQQKQRISLAKERLGILLSQAIPLYEERKDVLEGLSSNDALQPPEHSDAPQQDTTHLSSTPKPSYLAMLKKDREKEEDEKTEADFLKFLQKNQVFKTQEEGLQC